MNAGAWGTALINAAATASAFIGAAIGAVVFLAALVWGVRKGYAFLLDVVNADRNGYTFDEWRDVRASAVYDGASGDDAGDYAFFYKEAYDSVHDDFDDGTKHAFAKAYADNAIQQGWERE